MKHPKATGEKTEAIVIAELVRRDYIVLKPFGDNQRYDLVLDTPKGFKKVQVKTGYLKDGSVHFSTASVSSNTKGSKRRSYKGEVDYFAVFCEETNKTYLVPEELVGVSQQSLRVEPLPKNISPERVCWAKQFELGPPAEGQSLIKTSAPD